MTPKKILLVDDSKTGLMMERTILEKWTKYQCVTAMDGLEAIAKANDERPDLVLMDVVMPRMNGFEACKRMRQQDATREVPIVLLTTRGEEAYMEAGFESGCNDYLTKPVNGDELLRLLQSYLGEWGRVSALSTEAANEHEDRAMTASAPQMSQGVDPRLEAAHKRLSETGSQADAFEAIREIVTNLLGCEEMGIFAPADGNSKLLWSFGIDTERYTSLEGFEKSAMRQVKSGECHIAQVAGEDDPSHSDSLPRAFVPILLMDAR
jgi:CheY-like chemotaxis protein